MRIRERNCNCLGYGCIRDLGVPLLPPRPKLDWERAAGTAAVLILTALFWIMVVRWAWPW